jgi:hypothetical protein
LLLPACTVPNEEKSPETITQTVNDLTLAFVLVPDSGIHQVTLDIDTNETNIDPHGLNYFLTHKGTETVKQLSFTGGSFGWDLLPNGNNDNAGVFISHSYIVDLKDGTKIIRLVLVANLDQWHTRTFDTMSGYQNDWIFMVTDTSAAVHTYTATLAAEDVHENPIASSAAHFSEPPLNPGNHPVKDLVASFAVLPDKGVHRVTMDFDTNETGIDLNSLWYSITNTKTTSNKPMAFGDQSVGWDLSDTGDNDSSGVNISFQNITDADNTKIIRVILTANPDSIVKGEFTSTYSLVNNWIVKAVDPNSATHTYTKTIAATDKYGGIVSSEYSCFLPGGIK